MSIGAITIILFMLVLFALLAGVPVAFALGGIAVLFIFWQTGPKFLTIISTTAFDSWTSEILIAIPLFVMMANLLQRSGIAQDLYDTMYKWVGPLPGGLAIGTVAVCAVFAAMSGISAVATVTMGLVALPSMLQRGYDKKVALGCIAAGGTLGILIPPSIIMILYASLTEESVGQLFIAGFIPGFLLASIFMLYIGILTFFKPELGPPVPPDQRATWREKLFSLRNIIFPLLLVCMVLGVIYLGVCTPTEASGIGAFGAFLCVLVKKKMSWLVFKDACTDTLRITCMVLWIVLGAKLFTHVYHALGAPELIFNLIIELGLSKLTVLFMMILILFVLGMFIDPIGMMMITLPVFEPLLVQFDFNRLWFGILLTINIELAYITPPFGFNLFYMKSVVPEDISLADIYRACFPYIVLELIAIVILIIWPQIVLWLPSVLSKV